MTTKNPFGPGGPFNDPFKREREQAEMIRRALGPGYELQQRMKALESPLATIRDLQRSDVFAHLTSLQNNGVLSTARASTMFHSNSIKAMQALATPSWMQALQSTAVAISQRDLGILETQKRLAGSTGPDVVSLARTFSANPSIVETMMNASKWSDQFRALSERFAPSLAGIKLAAERARMLDMVTLGAGAEVASRSAVVVAAGQILEAHRLIEAIGQASTPEQSASLFAALLSVIGALFSGFGENTLKEMRGIGAFRLIELVLMAIAIFHIVVPAEMSLAEQKVVAEMKVEVATLQDKLDKIIATNEAANEAYVSDLPRAELKRDAAIRRDPQGKAPVLMRATEGMALAVKQSHGKWRLVVYRDQLTDQLSEGWVYAPAVELLDDPDA
jgi:uncharacterized coiled-coil protein SlyX